MFGCHTKDILAIKGATKFKSAFHLQSPAFSFGPTTTASSPHQPASPWPQRVFSGQVMNADDENLQITQS